MLPRKFVPRALASYCCSASLKAFDMIIIIVEEEDHDHIIVIMHDERYL